MNSTEEQPRNCTFLDYVENHPVAAITQALAIGFAVGLAVRLIENAGGREARIDIKKKPTLDDAKFHLGSLLLPFLWPAWQKAQEGYGKSSETVRDTLDKLKKSDLSDEGRKHLKKAEEWAEREAEHLAKLGKSKAKEVEKWVEEEVLPAAESGWKKLRKYFG